MPRLVGAVLPTGGLVIAGADSAAAIMDAGGLWALQLAYSRGLNGGKMDVLKGSGSSCGLASFASLLQDVMYSVWAFRS